MRDFLHCTGTGVALCGALFAAVGVGMLITSMIVAQQEMAVTAILFTITGCITAMVGAITAAFTMPLPPRKIPTVGMGISEHNHD